MARGKHKKKRERRKRGGNQNKPPANPPPQPPATEPVQPSPENQSPSQSADQTTAKQNERESPSSADRAMRWQIWCAIAQVVLSVCLVVFTAGQVIVGHWQFTATNDQYKAMLEQNKIAQGQLEQAAKGAGQVERQLAMAESDQRAWVYVSITTEPQPSGKNPRIAWQLTNIGRTPARTKSVELLADVFGPDPRLSAVVYKYAAIPGQFVPGQWRDTERMEFILVPGIPHPLPSQSFPTFDYADERKFNSGEYRLTLTAVIEYEDMSGRSGETRMTWRWNPGDKKFSQEPYFQHMK